MAATKEFYHDIDLKKVSQILNFRVHNVTNSSRTTLGGLLSTTHKGIHVWDTDDSKQYYWDGSAWVEGVTTITGAMAYRGTYSSLVTAPSSTADGYTYYMNAAGTLSWAGITFNPSADVEIGDLVVRRDATHWDVVQGNAIPATESNSGIIEIATQAETNTGTDDTRAITPLKLTSFCNTKAFSKTYFNSSNTLVADTPYTVTHGLALQNKDAFIISVKDSTGSEVSVDADSVDANSLTITSAIAASGITITVIGF